MKLLKLTFLLLLLAMTGRAATVTFSVTNNVGPDTNSILIQPISSYINADGSVQSTCLPFRIFPTNGFALTVLQPGNYLATNSFICSQYVGPGNFGTSQGVIFAVPNSSGTFSFGQLAISGYNVFNYNGASFVVTASNIFAAMGYTPLTPQQVTNLFLLSNTNIYQASTNIVFVISNGITLVTATPQGFLTNGLVGPGITNGLATTNYANSVTNGFTSIVSSNPASFTTPLQATNIAYNQATNQGAASTNMTLSASNALAFIITASLQGTNGALTATIIASNATQAASLLAATNALWAGKQPSNGVLTALAGTGAYTNNLGPGTNVTFVTNLSTYVVTIQVPTQGWLTNLLGSAAYASISAFLPASILPGLTNGFLPLNGTNGLLGTNVAYSTFYLQSNPSNYVSAVVTNGLASIQFVLSSIAASNGSFATLSQVQSSNNAAITAAAALATNFGYQIGTGATNFANGVGQGATNLAYLIGLNGTNNSQALSNNVLNASAVVSTNYANIVGAAATNNLNSASNALALTLGGLQLRAITNFNFSAVTLTNPANNIAGILSGTAAGVSNLPASSITNAGILIYSNTVTSNNIAGKINIGQIFGAATTNSFLPITNGFAQNQFGFGTRTNFTVTTNVVGILGGGSGTEGTYIGIPFNMTWTNFWNTNFTILASAGNYFLMSNSTSLYSSPDMINWSLVSGVLPVPTGFFGTKWHMTGSLVDGWLTSTNLTASTMAQIVNFFSTNQSTVAAAVSATNFSVLGSGPHAGQIAFPNGDKIVELSQANANRAGDSGVSIGITNGQILGEQFSFVAGAFNDVAGQSPTGPYVYGAAIPGGFDNIIGDGGGSGNWGDGSYSYIAGGASNSIFGNGSFGAGRYSMSLQPGDFTWDDGTFPSTANVAPYMFLILASNGVAIDTTNAGYALNVGGTVNASGYFVGGTPLMNISSNALGNLNGTATNATLFGTNSISGFKFYQTFTPRTNALIVSGAPITNLNFPSLNGEWDWNPTILGGIFTNTAAGYGAETIGFGGAQGFMIGRSPLFTGPTTNLFTALSGMTGTYTGAFPNAQFGNAATLTVTWLHPYWATNNLNPVGISTNSYMLVNYAGQSGGEILFPGGDAIYEQSPSDNNNPSDSGLSLGLNNGQIFGEEYSTVLGAYNDVAGFYASSIRGASVLGGTNNIIGNILSLPFTGGDGSWSTIGGGVSNQINSAYSFSLGSYNTITNNNSGIISDGSGPQTTTTSNQLVLAFQRGVSIGTNSAGTNQLAVNGSVAVNGDLIATNLIILQPVQQFERLSGIAAGTTADTDLQRMWGVFAANGRTANVVDIIPLGAQFNPTNFLTFAGRNWTHPPGLALPRLGDPNYAVFTNYGCGMELDGLNLNSNYMVMVVFSLDPAGYPGLDQIMLNSGIGNNSQVMLSLINSNDNSGVYATAQRGRHALSNFAVFPRGAGTTTNNVFQGGVSFGPTISTSTNLWLRQTEFNNQAVNEVTLNHFVLSGNTSGFYQMFDDDVGGFFNNGNAAETNYFQAPPGQGTNFMTSLRIGGDTNVCSFLPDLTAVVNQTNGDWRIQSVFIFNTNDTALRRMAYSASWYLGTQRKVYFHWGGSSLFDAAEAGNDNVNFSASTNSMIAQIQSQNPDWVVENFSTGGQTLLGMLTNSLWKAPVPYDPIFDIPRPDLTVVVGGDGDRNLAVNSTLYPPQVILPWWNQLYAPIASNGIPIWAWKTYMVGTNSANWSVASSSNLLSLNNSYDTNGLVSRVLDMARHVTNGSFTNSSSDSTHMLLNGTVYNECAREFGGIQGTIPILWQDTYTISSAPGWTNWTEQMMTVYPTAGTGIQFKDRAGNNTGPSFTAVSGQAIPLGPQESFIGTTVSATIKDNALQ